MTPRRIVGVDYGTKRVGLAVADPLRLFAQPHGTFTPDAAVAELQRLDERDGIEVLVVGWPLTEAGEEGAATERVQQFVNRLAKVLRGTEVVRWDERYTSELAKELVRQAQPRRKLHQARGRVDAAAAAIVLQEYLDSGLGVLGPGS